MKRVLIAIFQTALLIFMMTGMAGAGVEWGAPVEDSDSEGNPIVWEITENNVCASIVDNECMSFANPLISKNQMLVKGTSDDSFTFNKKGDTQKWEFVLPANVIPLGFSFVGGNVLGLDVSGIANEGKAMAEILFDGLTWQGLDANNDTIDTEELELRNTPTDVDDEYAHSFIISGSTDPVADNHRLVVTITSVADEPFTVDELTLEIRYYDRELTWTDPISVDADINGDPISCDIEGEDPQYIEYQLNAPRKFDSQGQTHIWRFDLQRGPIVEKDTFPGEQRVGISISSDIDNEGNARAEILLDSAAWTGTDLVLGSGQLDTSNLQLRYAPVNGQPVSYRFTLTSGSLEDDYYLEVAVTSLTDEPFNVDQLIIQLNYCKFSEFDFRSSSSSCFIKTLYK